MEGAYYSWLLVFFVVQKYIILLPNHCSDCSGWVFICSLIKVFTIWELFYTIWEL